MMQYVNCFNCASNVSKSEIVLNLIQEQPIVEADGSISSVTAETISSVAMTYESAKRLIAVLTHMVGGVE